MKSIYFVIVSFVISLAPTLSYSSSFTPEQNADAIKKLSRANDRNGITAYFEKNTEREDSQPVLDLGFNKYNLEQFLQEFERNSGNLTRALTKYANDKHDPTIPVLESLASERIFLGDPNRSNSICSIEGPHPKVTTAIFLVPAYPTVTRSTTN